MKIRTVSTLLLFLVLLGTIPAIHGLNHTSLPKAGFIDSWMHEYPGSGPYDENSDDMFYLKLSEAAMARTAFEVKYVPDYVRINYPMGDVPETTGVCTDVLIRAYRAVGIDLQKDVHEDMTEAFLEYPKMWRLVRPDTNIDHRRVPNLMMFFKRNGIVLPISKNAEDYSPGDVVAWDLGGGITHIGIVVNQRDPVYDRYQIVHNIGAGPKLEDRLFSWRIIGHFRYYGK